MAGERSLSANRQSIKSQFTPHIRPSQLLKSQGITPSPAISEHKQKDEPK